MLLAEIKIKESALARKVWDDILGYAQKLNNEFKQQHRRYVFSIVPSYGGDGGDIVLLRQGAAFRDLFKIEAEKVHDFIKELELVPIEIKWDYDSLDQYVISVKSLK